MTTLTLKRKVSVPFPSLVTGTGGIKVVKANGLWTISPDFAALGAISAANVNDPSQKQIWIWDPVSGQYNVLTLAGLGDALYKATSTTSLAIGAGAKTFATQANKDVGVGSWVIATSDAAPTTNYMLGQVTSYDASGNLALNVINYGGTGTHTDWTLRASSPPGSAGRSAGFSFAWLTSTANTDPGAGNVKANNATFGSITSIYISETDADGNALAAEIAASLSGTSTVKSRLKLYDPVNPANFMTFDVTALADNGAWDTLTVTPVANGGAFTAALALRVSFSAKGDKGNTGSTPAVQFIFSTTTADADPGSGNFRLNNATLASATAAYIDNNESGGTDVTAWLDTFDDTGNSALRGTLLLVDPNVAGVFRLYSVSGSVVDGTGYRKLTLAHLSGNGAFTNGAAVAAVFMPRGATGAGDLSSTNNLSDVANKQTSYDNLSLHGADIASAATLNLDTATGYLVDVTGTTTITAITLSDGKDRIVRFTGALTLTNGASLVLPGGANIATAAGDYAVFVGYAAGVVRCASYNRAAGRPLNSAVSDALTAGFTSASVSAGTKTTGTYTFDPTAGAVQHVTNGGAHTFAPPATNGAWILDYINNVSAGALTTSGWTKVDGDPFDTTNGHAFRCMLSVGNQGSYLSVKRMV